MADADVNAKVKKQIEFYFGDSNMPRDKFLKGEAEKDADGWVPIATLLTFKRLSDITKDADVVANAVKDSTVVEVSADNKSIKRSAPLAESADYLARCIYVKKLPTNGAEIEDIEAFFKKDGEIKSVRRRHNVNDKTFKGSAFVEFATEDQAKAAAANKQVYTSGEELEVVLRTDYQEKKKAERIAKRTEVKKTTGGKRKAEDDEPSTADIPAAPEFAKGLIVKVDNIGNGASREDLRQAFEKFGAVGYIDFSRDENSGYVRMAEAPSAEKAAAELTAAKLQIGGQEVALKVLEGEDEQAYWVKLNQARDTKFASGGAKKARGGGRGRGGRGRGGRGRGGRGGRS